MDIRRLSILFSALVLSIFSPLNARADIFCQDSYGSGNWSCGDSYYCGYSGYGCFNDNSFSSFFGNLSLGYSDTSYDYSAYQSSSYDSVTYYPAQYASYYDGGYYDGGYYSGSGYYDYSSYPYYYDNNCSNCGYYNNQNWGCPSNYKICGGGCIPAGASCCDQTNGLYCDAGQVCQGSSSCITAGSTGVTSYYGPVVRFTSPRGGKRVRRNFLVRGRYNSNSSVDHFEYMVDGQNSWTAFSGSYRGSRSGIWNLSVRSLRRGPVTVRVRAVDSTNTSSSIAGRTFNVR